jgi:FkbM family methyltransferase
VLGIEKEEGERRVLSRLLQSLEIGDTAYDIGANIGIHSFFMAKKVSEKGKVIAFEPHPDTYKSFLGNLNLNNLKNIIPVQVALGESVSEGKLYWLNNIVGSYSLIGDKRQECFSDIINIYPGDLLIERLRLPLPRVVKIDVEGYEYYVLKGLKRALSSEICRMLCCEIHTKLLPLGIDKETIINLLNSFGFREIDLVASGKDVLHAFCYKY